MRHAGLCGIVIVVAGLGVAGCSITVGVDKRPHLLPNGHLEAVGEEQALKDIEECEEKADAAGLLMAGSRNREGLVGAARQVSHLGDWVPSREFRKHVETCLRKLGYAPSGRWDYL